MKTKTKIIIGATTPFALFILFCLLGLLIEPGTTSTELQEIIDNANRHTELSNEATIRYLGKESTQKVYDSTKEEAEKWKTLRDNARNEQEYRQYDMAYRSAIEAAEIIKKDAAKVKVKIKN